MAAAYCDVAVPVPLHETFTYRIPPELRERICVGGRVVVPFGRRKLVGVVTAVSSEPRHRRALKDVKEVIDDEPVLPSVLQDLGRWMTEEVPGSR